MGRPPIGERAMTAAAPSSWELTAPPMAEAEVQAPSKPHPAGREGVEASMLGTGPDPVDCADRAAIGRPHL
jgi:hypothetical protein